ncbi:YfcE family phosphodiesterase [Christensenellaceae bacterium OttesenSCG-928-K19]|nr:YfcE family phosphodiesterase [Christensenellaceae bacterium OttesenSCG-928-K19]
MKALVVSDSHGNKNILKTITQKYADMEYLFHLGDYVQDAYYLADNMPNTKVLNVKGNCDVGSADPEFEEIVLEGNRIILTHGHLLKVKFSYDRALYYAADHNAAALLFGHSHIAYTEYVDGVWLVNPGSAGEHNQGPLSVAVLVISKAGIVPKIIALEGD